MTEEQVALLLGKASAAYPKDAPDFNADPQIYDEWVEALADVDPRIAFENYRIHRATRDWFPKISQIVTGGFADEDDPEIRARNIQIAHQQWVAAGGDPEAFVYGRVQPQLRG